MDLSDELVIPAPRDRVYNALQDPEILRRCIPGCEELVKHSDTELEAKVVLKVGPVKARFAGKVLLNPENPPEKFSLQGEGSGGVAGFAKGGAEVFLEDRGSETLLRYDAKADIGGKLAQLGSRLIQGTAKKLAASFFEELQKVLSEEAATS
ncbi:CoxG family protein [Thioclava sp. FR2]|uniref:CoxG family protein n=1 Tax=Thioclava sp. FR2 TaxID=3445780 RepID=UPI003EB835B6